VKWHYLVEVESGVMVLGAFFFGETKAEFQVPADEISGNIRGWDPLENSFVIESFGRICFDED